MLLDDDCGGGEFNAILADVAAFYDKLNAIIAAANFLCVFQQKGANPTSVVVVVLGFYVPQTIKFIRRRKKTGIELSTLCLNKRVAKLFLSQM